MKSIKILAISLAAVFMSFGVAFATDQPTTIGEIKRVTGARQAEPTRTFKLVRYSAQNLPAIAAGDAVVYDTISDDGVTVRLTTTSADGAIAGIAVTAIQTCDNANNTTASDDEGKRNWGYIQVHGPVSAKVSAGGTNGNAVGDFFITSGDSGAVTTIQNRGSALAASANGLREVAANGGFFLDAADGTSTTSDVFLTLE